MTLRHIVLMRFPDAVDPEYLARMDRAVAELAASVPEVLSSTGGADASGKEENFDYAIIFDFNDAEAYERYRAHPAHRAFIAEFMKGRAIEKVRIQVTVPSAGRA